jgi:hypothetical protein
LEGSGPGLIEVSSRNLLKWVRKATKNRITDVLAKIRTAYLRNASHECYRYANMFVGVKIIY